MASVIPQDIDYSKWLVSQGFTPGSIASYRTYLRTCIDHLASNGISLYAIVTQYLQTKDYAWLIQQLDVCFNLLDASGLSSKYLSGFSKYVAFHIKSINPVRNLGFSRARIKIESGKSFCSECKRRFASDSRANYPMKQMKPIFGPITASNGKTITQMIDEAIDYTVILTEDGVVHLKCVACFIFISQAPYDIADVYIVLKGMGTVLRVFGYLSKKTAEYVTGCCIAAPMRVKFFPQNNHNIDEVKQITREHFPEISHVIRKQLPLLPNLQKANTLVKYKSLGSLTNTQKKALLDEIMHVENIVTYTLMLEKHNKSKGNGRKSSKKNTSKNKVQETSLTD